MVLSEDDLNLFEGVYGSGCVPVRFPGLCLWTHSPAVGFFSRMRPLFHVYPELMRDKIGSAFAVGGTRNGGEEATITAMHNMMMARGINIVCNEVYGYAGGYIWSKDQGQEGVDADEIGMGGLLKLANKLADMALIREYGKKALEEREAAVNERD